MHPLVLLPLIACVVCSAYCLTATPATYNMGNRRLRWLGKLLFGCPALWAFGEVGLGLSGTENDALSFVPLVTTAIVAVGPIGVDTAQALALPGSRRLSRTVRVLYGAGAVLVLSTWFTPWFVRGVVPMRSGFALDPGPLYPLYIGFVTCCGVFAYKACREVVADTTEVRPDARGNGITAGVLLVIVIGALTDGVLPSLGVQGPRLATTAFALLAGWLLWSMSRPQGYVFASQAIISREILRSIHEGVVFVTLEDRVLLANEGMETFLGAPAERIVGRRFQPHVPGLSLAGPQERIDVECSLIPFAGPPITVAASVSTARDHRGEPLGLVVVVRDLRQVELLRSQLVTSGRLAAVGQLAAGIAHEINNPLAFVRTNLGVLREHWSVIAKAFEAGALDEPASEALRDGEEIIVESIEGVDRAAHIVRDVREFSHSGRPERERVDVNDLLDRVLRISKAELGSRLLVQRDYARLPLVMASPQQLKQVFLNLVVNAAHATGSQGTVWVSSRLEADQVVVRIADDGCGIPPEVGDRIFDPFFTTKSVGEGTGLGLSISHQIVQSHGGDIAVERRDGPGACLRVRIPVEHAPRDHPPWSAARKPE